MSGTGPRFDRRYAVSAYMGSNGDVTRALYDHLKGLGPLGELAVNLMRATKSSERAKVYRRGNSTRAAYDTKQWALANICRTLAKEAFAEIPTWGWGTDVQKFEAGDPHYHVLYVDLPTGQASWHTDFRCEGPDYPGERDGMRGVQVNRVLRFVGRVLGDETAEAA
jgi:hypothetical protein